MHAGARIGTAGWSIPKLYAEEFPAAGTHLQRYARVFNAVEINSSFYRHHKPQTYARWAASVPDGFRFAVKVLRDITHTHKLVGVTQIFDRFLAEVGALGDRLGPLLVQLPPSLRYSANAGKFFALVRDRFQGDVVCEPRHASWFTLAATETLERYHIARVAADPARVPEAGVPGGWLGLTYRRLHGSPRIYYSKYEAGFIDALAQDIAPNTSSSAPWCIFDNTALGEATGDALELLRRLTAYGSDTRG